MNNITEFKLDSIKLRNILTGKIIEMSFDEMLKGFPVGYIPLGYDTAPSLRKTYFGMDWSQKNGLTTIYVDSEMNNY